MENKEYIEWENQVEVEKKINHDLLLEFGQRLKSQKLKSKIIKNHRANIELYINTFLLRNEIIPAQNGAKHIGYFLGDFFIRKASLVTKSTIREFIAGFINFYTFLNEIGKLSDIDLAEMKELIKDEKDCWLEKV
ncbi:MAG: hypothetical protein Q7J16_01955 [Candidatus Cloacimonadales bacterium]|nr:hypothetical protein [Candidatus Cloacimonadales bacterium]